MNLKIQFHLTFLSFLLYTSICFGQQGRIVNLQQLLDSNRQTIPELNKPISADLTDVSLNIFLTGIARTCKINLEIAPDIKRQVALHFNKEKLLNVLAYLAATYDLDIHINGRIITMVSYSDPNRIVSHPPKAINCSLNNGLLSLDLREDSLLVVARKITDLTGRNIIIVPSLYGKLLSGYIHELPLTGALDKIAITNKIKFTITNDSSFLAEPLEAGESLIPQTRAVPGSNYTLRHSGSNGNYSSSAIEGDEQNEERLLSINVVNMPIRELVQNIMQQAAKDYFIYSDIQGSITANIKNKPLNYLLDKVFLGTLFTYSLEKGVYLIGERNFEGLRKERLVKLKYRSVDSLIGMIPQSWKQQVTLSEFKELNSFLISGSEPQIDEIDSFVTKLDQRVPMVLLEVIMLDINKDRTLNTGIKMGTSDSVTTGGSLLGGGLNFTLGAKSINNFINKIGLNSVFNLGHVGSSFYTTLQAIEANKNTEIRQTPKLSTLNGHTASMSIGNTRYYKVTTQNTIGSLATNTIQTVQYNAVEANLILNITPFVSGDENVTLNLDLNITDFTTNTDSSMPPPTSTSKYKSIIRVHNEDMVLLGGIERTEKIDSYSGVPLLSRIPILKWLFSSKTKENTKVVSIVFIKPTVIY